MVQPHVDWGLSLFKFEKENCQPNPNWENLVENIWSLINHICQKTGFGWENQTPDCC